MKFGQDICIGQDICMDRASGLMSKVFPNGPGDSGFNPRLSHTKDSKNGT